MILFAGHGQHKHGNENEANKHMHKNSIEELSKRFEDKERAVWQKPEEVIAMLGDLKGKTVLDIGAGTGYFTFKIADQGAHVIAADVNDDFQNFIALKKKELSYTDDQIALRKIPYDAPGLEREEVDVVIIVNTYHHIENRIPYFKQVLKGLRPNGVLMVVDFAKKEFDEAVPGPPVTMRITREQVQEELTQSGFTNFSIDTELLKFQYILMAYK